MVDGFLVSNPFTAYEVPASCEFRFTPSPTTEPTLPVQKPLQTCLVHFSSSFHRLYSLGEMLERRVVVSVHWVGYGEGSKFWSATG